MSIAAYDGHAGPVLRRKKSATRRPNHEILRQRLDKEGFRRRHRYPLEHGAREAPYGSSAHDDRCVSNLALRSRGPSSAYVSRERELDGLVHPSDLDDFIGAHVAQTRDDLLNADLRR